MLIDPGSELTFASEQLIQQLRVSRHHSSILIFGVGGAHLGHTRGMVALQLKSLYSPLTMSLMAHILVRLTSTLPSFSAPQVSWTYLDGLQLADPDYLTPGLIDLFIGADSYGDRIKPELINGTGATPITQRTIFGWIILGPISPGTSPPGRLAHHATVSHDVEDFQELLSRFWVQEEVPQMSPARLSPDEAECEQHFKSIHSRDNSGRYTVRFPRKSPASQLGDSKLTARRSLQRIFRRRFFL